MKDDKGLFYYPFPDNRRARMYVREAEGAIWFRLWNADDPKIWEEHGWVPYGAIQQAIAVYKGGGFDPRRAYDINVAEMLLKEIRAEDQGDAIS